MTRLMSAHHTAFVDDERNVSKIEIHTAVNPRLHNIMSGVMVECLNGSTIYYLIASFVAN